MTFGRADGDEKLFAYLEARPQLGADIDRGVEARCLYCDRHHKIEWGGEGPPPLEPDNDEYMFLPYTLLDSAVFHSDGLRSPGVVETIQLALLAGATITDCARKSGGSDCDGCGYEWAANEYLLSACVAPPEQRRASWAATTLRELAAKKPGKARRAAIHAAFVRDCCGGAFDDDEFRAIVKPVYESARPSK